MAVRGEKATITTTTIEDRGGEMFPSSPRREGSFSFSIAGRCGGRCGGEVAVAGRHGQMSGMVGERP